MYLLPKMGPEDLNQGDLERRNLAVQEDTGQIQLHLETDVDVCPVNGLQQKSVYRTIIFIGRLTERGRSQRNYAKEVIPEEIVPEEVVPLETISVETTHWGCSQRRLSNRRLSHRRLSHRKLSHRRLSHRRSSH